jgi:hypothetical protein
LDKVSLRPHRVHSRLRLKAFTPYQMNTKAM